jgi:dUTP pyrophosphatase
MGKPQEEDKSAGKLLCTLTLPGAKLLHYGSTEAAGLELFNPQECTLPSGKRLLIDTGIQIQMPPGHYGRIASTSGLALRQSLEVAAGVLDADYRGNIQVLLCNNGITDCTLSTGAKIAQLICEQISRPKVVAASTLTTTARGQEGFGSTDPPVVPRAQETFACYRFYEPEMPYQMEPSPVQTMAVSAQYQTEPSPAQAMEEPEEYADLEFMDTLSFSTEGCPTEIDDQLDAEPQDNPMAAEIARMSNCVDQLAAKYNNAYNLSDLLQFPSLANSAGHPLLRP